MKRRRDTPSTTVERKKNIKTQAARKEEKSNPQYTQTDLTDYGSKIPTQQSSGLEPFLYDLVFQPLLPFPASKQQQPPSKITVLPTPHTNHPNQISQIPSVFDFLSSDTDTYNKNVRHNSIQPPTFNANSTTPNSFSSEPNNDNGQACQQGRYEEIQEELDSAYGLCNSTTTPTHKKDSRHSCKRTRLNFNLLDSIFTPNDQLPSSNVSTPSSIINQLGLQGDQIRNQQIQISSPTPTSGTQNQNERENVNHVTQDREDTINISPPEINLPNEDQASISQGTEQPTRNSTQDNRPLPNKSNIYNKNNETRTQADDDNHGMPPGIIAKMDGFVILGKTWNITDIDGIIQLQSTFTHITPNVKHRYKGVPEVTRFKHLYEINLTQVDNAELVMLLGTNSNTVRDNRDGVTLFRYKHARDRIPWCLVETIKSIDCLTARDLAFRPDGAIRITKLDWPLIGEAFANRLNHLNEMDHLFLPIDAEFYFALRKHGQDEELDFNLNQVRCPNYNMENAVRVVVHIAFDFFSENHILWFTQKHVDSLGIPPKSKYNVSLIKECNNYVFDPVPENPEKISHIQLYTRIFHQLHRDRYRLLVDNFIGKTLAEIYAEKYDRSKKPGPRKASIKWLLENNIYKQFSTAFEKDLIRQSPSDPIYARVEFVFSGTQFHPMILQTQVPEQPSNLTHFYYYAYAEALSYALKTEIFNPSLLTATPVHAESFYVTGINEVFKTLLRTIEHGRKIVVKHLAHQENIVPDIPNILSVQQFADIIVAEALLSRIIKGTFKGFPNYLSSLILEIDPDTGENADWPFVTPMIQKCPDKQILYSGVNINNLIRKGIRLWDGNFGPTESSNRQSDAGEDAAVSVSHIDMLDKFAQWHSLSTTNRQRELEDATSKLCDAVVKWIVNKFNFLHNVQTTFNEAPLLSLWKHGVNRIIGPHHGVTFQVDATCRFFMRFTDSVFKTRKATRPMVAFLQFFRQTVTHRYAGGAQQALAVSLDIVIEESVSPLIVTIPGGSICYIFLPSTAINNIDIILELYQITFFRVYKRYIGLRRIHSIYFFKPFLHEYFNLTQDLRNQIRLQTVFTIVNNLLDNEHEYDYSNFLSLPANIQNSLRPELHEIFKPTLDRLNSENKILYPASLGNRRILTPVRFLQPSTPSNLFDGIVTRSRLRTLQAEHQESLQSEPDLEDFVRPPEFINLGNKRQQRNKRRARPLSSYSSDEDRDEFEPEIDDNENELDLLSDAASSKTHIPSCIVSSSYSLSSRSSDGNIAPLIHLQRRQQPCLRLEPRRRTQLDVINTPAVINSPQQHSHDEGFSDDSNHSNTAKQIYRLSHPPSEISLQSYDATRAWVTNQKFSQPRRHVELQDTPNPFISTVPSMILSESQCDAHSVSSEIYNSPPVQYRFHSESANPYTTTRSPSTTSSHSRVNTNSVVGNSNTPSTGCNVLLQDIQNPYNITSSVSTIGAESGVSNTQYVVSEINNSPLVRNRFISESANPCTTNSFPSTISSHSRVENNTPVSYPNAPSTGSKDFLRGTQNPHNITIFPSNNGLKSRVDTHSVVKDLSSSPPFSNRFLPNTQNPHNVNCSPSTTSSHSRIDSHSLVSCIYNVPEGSEVILRDTQNPYNITNSPSIIGSELRYDTNLLSKISYSSPVGNTLLKDSNPYTITSSPSTTSSHLQIQTNSVVSYKNTPSEASHILLQDPQNPNIVTSSLAVVSSESPVDTNSVISDKSKSLPVSNRLLSESANPYTTNSSPSTTSSHSQADAYSAVGCPNTPSKASRILFRDVQNSRSSIKSPKIGLESMVDTNSVVADTTNLQLVSSRLLKETQNPYNINRSASPTTSNSRIDTHSVLNNQYNFPAGNPVILRDFKNPHSKSFHMIGPKSPFDTYALVSDKNISPPVNSRFPKETLSTYNEDSSPLATSSQSQADSSSVVSCPKTPNRSHDIIQDTLNPYNIASSPSINGSESQFDTHSVVSIITNSPSVSNRNLKESANPYATTSSPSSNSSHSLVDTSIRYPNTGSAESFSLLNDLENPYCPDATPISKSQKTTSSVVINQIISQPKSNPFAKELETPCTITSSLSSASSHLQIKNVSAVGYPNTTPEKSYLLLKESENPFHTDPTPFESKSKTHDATSLSENTQQHQKYRTLVEPHSITAQSTLSEEKLCNVFDNSYILSDRVIFEKSNTSNTNNNKIIILRHLPQSRAIKKSATGTPRKIITPISLPNTPATPRSIVQKRITHTPRPTKVSTLYSDTDDNRSEVSDVSALSRGLLFRPNKETVNYTPYDSVIFTGDSNRRIATLQNSRLPISLLTTPIPAGFRKSLSDDKEPNNISVSENLSKTIDNDPLLSPHHSDVESESSNSSIINVRNDPNFIPWDDKVNRIVGTPSLSSETEDDYEEQGRRHRTPCQSKTKGPHTPSRSGCQRTRKFYSAAETKLMFNWLHDNRVLHAMKGLLIFKVMEIKKVLPNRPYQSMHNNIKNKLNKTDILKNLLEQTLYMAVIKAINENQSDAHCGKLSHEQIQAQFGVTPAQLGALK